MRKQLLLFLLLAAAAGPAAAMYYSDATINRAGSKTYAEAVQGAPSLRHYDFNFQSNSYDGSDRRPQIYEHEAPEPQTRRIYYVPKRRTILGN